MKKIIIISSVISLVLVATVSVFAWQNSCNIASIKLNGQLTTSSDGYVYDNGSDTSSQGVSSDSIIKQIEKIKKRKSIKALLVDVNSNGGSVVAASEIYEALSSLKIPKEALVRENAFSAAYIAISGVDKIFVSKNSQVGAIGVTASYLQKYDKNRKEGIVFQELTSGKFKDLTNPNKVLTKEEKSFLQEIINSMHENVVQTVAEGRKQDVKTIRALADGSFFLGEAAIEKKLADYVGNLESAKSYLEKVINKKPNLCEIN